MPTAVLSIPILRAFIHVGCRNLGAGLHIRGPALGPACHLPGDRSGIPAKGYKQTESARGGHLSAMSEELGQHLLSGFNPAILSFLENGDAAEVGVGKEYAFIEARQAAALFGENVADGEWDHCLPPADRVE